MKGSRHEGVPCLIGVIFALWALASAARASEVEAWVQRHRPADISYDSAGSIAVDHDGGVIVAGYDGGATVIKYLNGGTSVWTNHYAVPGSRVSAQSVAVDANGNVYVLERTFPGHDFLLLSYSSAGVLLWTNFYNSPENYGFPVALALDGTSRIYAVGYCQIGYQYFRSIVAYSTAGVPLWTNLYNGGPLSSPTGVAVDGTGQLAVAGWGGTIAYSSGGAALWTNSAVANAVNGSVGIDGAGNVYVAGYGQAGPTNFDYDFTIVACSGSGFPLWTNRYGDPAHQDDTAHTLAVDKAGHVFVAGLSSNQKDIVTIAYSSNGPPLWTNLYNGPGNPGAEVSSMTVSDSGNVFLAGYTAVNNTNHDYLTLAYSGSGMPLWTNVYGGAASSDDQANSVASDGQGNVFVTGYSTRPGTGTDFATIAYSGSGTAIWTNFHNGSPQYNSSQARAVAVGPNGNVYLTGIGYDHLDYNTVGYSSAGLPLWTNRYAGTNVNSTVSRDEPLAMAVGSSGNVYVTGASYWGPGGEGGTFSDFTTIAYSSSGTGLWTNRYRVAPYYGLNVPRAMAVDNSGNVFITGTFNNDGSPLADYFTIAINSLGVQFWGGMGASGARYSYSASSDDQAQAIAVDGCGHVFVTGRSQHGDYLQGIGYDYATVAYSTAGAQLWVNRYDGPAGANDAAQAIAVDGCGNVYVTGNSPGIGTTNDYATLAYSNDGLPLWTNRYNGTGDSNDFAQALAVDATGRVYVTGYSWGGSSGYDYATIAYSSGGAPLWTNRYNGPANGDDFAEAIKVDASGNIYVSGHSTGAGTGYDLLTVAYASDGTFLWSKRYNGPINGNENMGTGSCLALGSGNSVYVAGTSDEDPFSTASVLVKYVSAPDILLTDARQMPGAARFTILAPSNITYRLESSSNLLNWVPLTNFSGVSSVQYTDTLSPDFLRFYRAVWLP